MNDSSTESPSRWPMVAYWVLAILGTVIGMGWYSQSARFNDDVGMLFDSATDSTLAAATIRYDDGRSNTLADFRGRYVLLDFWASWCPYCRLSMPVFEALQEKYPERLKVLAINTLESVADARAYLKKEQIGLELAQSPQLIEQLQVQVLPTTVLLDPNGKRVWATVGFVPLITPALLERQIAP